MTELLRLVLARVVAQNVRKMGGNERKLLRPRSLFLSVGKAHFLLVIVQGMLKLRRHSQSRRLLAF